MSSEDFSVDWAAWEPTLTPSPRAAASATRSKAKSKAAASKRWYCISCECSFATTAELMRHQETPGACLAVASGPAVAQSAQSPNPQLQTKASKSASAVARTKAAIQSATKVAMNTAHGLSGVAPHEVLYHAAKAELVTDQFVQAEEGSGGYESGSLSTFNASEGSVAQEGEDEAEQPWRCEECACGFALEDQFLTHCADHVVCPELECNFVAIGPVMRQHQVAAHGLVEPSCGSCGRLGHETSACRRALQSPARASQVATMGSRAEALKTPMDARVGARVPGPVTATKEAATEKPRAVDAAPWRCVACEYDFYVKVHLDAHNLQHWECSAPGCGYAAIKSRVNRHCLDAHGGAAWPKIPANVKLPAWYICRACGVPGHSISHCSMKKPGMANQEYLCKIYGVPGHYISQRPKKDQPTAGSGYVCNACGIPGHVIYQCEKKLGRNELAALHRQPQSRPQQTADEEASAAAADAPAPAWEWTRTPAESPASTTANSNKPYRCAPCGTELALQSQLVAHIKQHVVCPEPECGFSAAGRIVKEHARSVHGRAPANVSTTSNVSRADPENESDFVYYRGFKYRVQQAALEGSAYLVLEKVTGA